MIPSSRPEHAAILNILPLAAVSLARRRQLAEQGIPLPPPGRCARCADWPPTTLGGEAIAAPQSPMSCTVCGFAPIHIEVAYTHGKLLGA
jgi:hypothetical protein